MATDSTGPIIVTGGCGLLGYHIVQQLLKDASAGPITVISRSPKTNIFKGVSYIAGDITDFAFLEKTFTQVKPSIVIHTVSPRAIDENTTEDVWNKVNVGGIQNLLKVAQNVGTVKAFIQTSTVNVIQGFEHFHVAENAEPYWTAQSKAIPYWKTKAAQEQLVLAANSESFKTVAIRPCMIIGLQEHALIPAQLKALSEKKTGIQLGDNKNLFDIVSAENCAKAHILAMHALLDPSKANGAVAGEAFNVTNDNPLPFWDVQRVIWREAGDQTKLEDVKVIPKWLAKTMASVSELAAKFSFAGNKTPELNKFVVNFCTSNFSYDISKARTVLAYDPEKNTEQILKDATRWELDHRAATATTKTTTSAH